MISTIFFVTTTAASLKTLKNDKILFVPEDQWVCGATSYDKSLSYQRANESCQDMGWAINNCCAVHDLCYIQDKTQEECDVPFCTCLEEQAKLSSNSDCQSTLETFCFIVQLFGGIAHSNAKEKSNQTNTSNLTLTPTTTTTTTLPPRRLDATEEECFSTELNFCVAEFETCQSTDKIELLHCEERMCQCTRSALRNQAKPECRYPIEMACIIPDSYPLPSKENIKENNDEKESFLSRKIIILGFSATILTIFIFLIIAFLPFSLAIWSLYRYISKSSMSISPSRTPLCAASSTDTELGCGSIDTLSSDGGVKIVIHH